MMKPKHREVKPIPTDPAERKARVQWLLDHKVWTHKATVRMPANIEDMFAPIEGTDLFVQMKTDGADWQDEEFDDGSLYECAEFEYVYVNPEREYREDDDTLNTAFRIWIEAGPWHDQATDGNTPEPEGGWNQYNRWINSHDIRLDCGAATMEDALLELAALVECFYNEDGTDKNLWWCYWKDDQECQEGGDGYCVNCGFKVDHDEPEA